MSSLLRASATASVIGCARLIAAAVCLAALSACSSFDGQKPIMPGDRIPIHALIDEQPASAAQKAALAPLGPERTLNQWTQVNGNSAHAVGNLAGPAALKEAWRADVGAGADSSSLLIASPIVVAGKVYSLDAASSVTASDASSGAEIWTADLTPEDEDGRDGFGGGLAFANGALFATTGFGEILRLDPATGEIIWRMSVGAPIQSAPAAMKNRVVVVARDNVAYGLEASSGRIAWRVQSASGGAGLLGGASPAVSGGLAVLPFASGEVIAVSTATGRQAWSGILTGGHRGAALSAIDDITGDPVIAGQGVFLANQSGRFAAYDGRSGRRIWLRNFGSSNPVWIVGETLYILTNDHRLMRLAARDGSTLWSRDLPAFDDPEDREGFIVYGGPVVAGGRVLITSSEGKLLAFDAVTGAPADKASLSSGASTSPVVVEGTIYVLSDDATLHAFR